MKISFYENVAKNTIINGIKEPYHSFLTHFVLNDIEDYLNKCRRHDNHEHQANFLSYMRQRESKPKANLFNAPSTSKAAISFQPRPAPYSTQYWSNIASIFLCHIPHIRQYSLNTFIYGCYMGAILLQSVISISPLLFLNDGSSSLS